MAKCNYQPIDCKKCNLPRRDPVHPDSLLKNKYGAQLGHAGLYLDKLDGRFNTCIDQNRMYPFAFSVDTMSNRGVLIPVSCGMWLENGKKMKSH